MLAETDGCYQAAGGIEVTIMSVFSDDIAVSDITGGIAVRGFVKRRPGTHITPPGIEWHNDRIASLFHYCIIDRLAPAALEFSSRQAHEFQIHARGRDRTFANLKNVGRQALELLKVATRLENEHAAVPEVFARLNELPCASDVGLLHELSYWV